MSGNELVSGLLIFVLATMVGIVIPAAVFAWLRRFSSEGDAESEANPSRVLAVYGLGLIAIYAISVLRIWEGERSVAYLFISPIPISLLSLLYAVLMGAVIALLSRNLPRSKKHVMHHVVVVLLFGLGSGELLRIAERLARSNVPDVVATATRGASALGYPLATTPEGEVSQYNAMLDSFEARYSGVNPESDAYDQALVDRIATLIDERVSRGEHSAAALQQVAYEVTGIWLTIPRPSSSALTGRVSAAEDSAVAADRAAIEADRAADAAAAAEQATVSPRNRSAAAKGGSSRQPAQWDARSSQRLEDSTSTENDKLERRTGSPNRLPSWEEMRSSNADPADKMNGDGEE
jgi:hypothetical protein